MEFIIAVANMRAEMFNIKYDESIWDAGNRVSLIQMVNSVVTPVFR